MNKRKHPLKRYRFEQDLSQAELAEMIGVTFGAVSKWENRQRQVSPNTAKRISEITGIPVLELLYPHEDEAA